MKLLGWIMPLLLAAGAATGARADETLATLADAAQSARLNHYLYNELSGLLPGRFRAWDDERGASCADPGKATVTPAAVQSLIRPIVLKDGQTQPESGVLSVVFRFDRCGRSIHYRIQVQFEPGKPPAMRPILPGDSMTNTRLWRNVTPVITEAALSAAGDGGCRKAVLLDTFVLDKRGGESETVAVTAMRERWWFNACGTNVAIDADFFPDPDKPGMTFALRPAGNAGSYRMR